MYYIFHRDLQKKDNKIPDLSAIMEFCKKVIRKAKIAETRRKEKR